MQTILVSVTFPDWEQDTGIGGGQKHYTPPGLPSTKLKALTKASSSTKQRWSHELVVGSVGLLKYGKIFGNMGATARIPSSGKVVVQ